MNQQNKPQQINVQVPNEKSDILYTDQAFTTASASGFVFDFGQFTPQMNVTRIVSRVGMSPIHAKLFLRSLDQNIKSFEDKFGEIKITGPAENEFKERGIGFRPEQ